MIKVVFDTVIFVRALLNTRSLCGKLVFGYSGRYCLILSTPIVIEILQVLSRDEIVTKLEKRRNIYLEAVTGLLQSFEQAQAVNVKPISPTSRDPKDDKFLATALAAGADYLVSEDQDLLVLKTYKQIKIVTALEFLEILENDKNDPKN